jgi:hypothetical protein
LTGFHKVRNERAIVVFDECSERHKEFKVFAVPAVAQVSPSVLAVSRFPVWFAVVPEK